MEYLKTPLPWILTVAWILLLATFIINYIDSEDTKSNWSNKTIILYDGTIIVKGKLFGKEDGCPTFSKVVGPCGQTYWMRINKDLEESPLIVPKLTLNYKFKDNVVLQKDITISNKLSLTPFESSISDDEDIFTQKCRKCGSDLYWTNYSKTNIRRKL
jgi:hypothetical protein